MARCLSAQVRERRANDPKRRQHVDLEQSSCFGVRGFLERAQKAIARVVDDHVDCARAGKGLALPPLSTASPFVYIKLQDVQLAAPGRQIRRGVSNRSDDRVAFVQRRLGRWRGRVRAKRRL